MELEPAVIQATSDLFPPDRSILGQDSIVLSREQVRLVDTLAVQKFGLSGLVLMENAGRNAAVLLSDRYGRHEKAAILCGTGNNGGDGCVIARHLHNGGWDVRLLVIGELSTMTSDMLTNYRIVEAMGLQIIVTTHVDHLRSWTNSILSDEIVVDAMLGTGFRGQVRRPMAEVIEAVNSAPKQAMIAVDVPSGLDCDTGVPSQNTIRADLTISFVAIKRGFLTDSATPFIGEVVVAEIGVPRELIRSIAEGGA
ncbi:MAG: NAD(P)H-hydrate epimerase [Planctomycetota bacterium]